MNEPSSPASPKPLTRMGVYKLRIQDAPRQSVSLRILGDALGVFWREAIASVVSDKERRGRILSSLPGVGDSRARALYSNKIEIKSQEAVVALLHEILAPEADFLCDENCPHVRDGAAPEQVRAFLSSLKRAREDLGRELAHAREDLREDMLDEQGVYARAQKAFAELAIPIFRSSKAKTVELIQYEVIVYFREPTYELHAGHPPRVLPHSMTIHAGSPKEAELEARYSFRNLARESQVGWVREVVSVEVKD